MEWIESLIGVFSPSVLIFLILGVLAGYVIGVLPGLSATMAVAILTPVTFWLRPDQGFAMLIGVFNSAIFAGGISAVLINTPGTPASIASTFDGYAMTQKGQPGLALGLNTIFSCIGGWFGTLVLALAAFPLARFALKFGPTEYFAIAIFGLAMMVSVSGKSIIKGLMIGYLGLLLSTVGADPMFSTPRFTLGVTELFDGISFIPVMIGLFGLGEIWTQMYDGANLEKVERITCLGRIFPTWKEFKACMPGSVIASIISVFVGIIPGAGGDISGIISWDQAKRISKKPEEFGKGSVEGVAVTSLSNNAALGGALITMMTLGVPGEAVSAVLIGALMMYGMDPGPSLFSENAAFVHTFIMLMMVAYVLIMIIGLLSAKHCNIILNVKKELIWMTVIVFCVVGAFSMNSSYIDVVIMAISGFAGFFFRKMNYPLGPIILGLLLGNMAESNFRRSMAMFNGSYTAFFTNPISAVLLTLAALAIVVPLIKHIFKKRENYI
ncbi:tripartite tricarboxylate transporter permease [Alkalibacter saccharofermentans]|uniref:Putative tricarboxylic transport membrane protein n=1 Tax=Alkalibacter saccharofermentans DSM 14828 TaxID=1120975 RepID=A0A1M4WGZ3_9FIRM|nr:tripartite tricarboxylate transporter permease [Alkalibacter saccharofermentans]SHE80551.1 putative tricarboxylic transport membrane protein [Alkalibacter saccharofermentans DSM 14828]